MPEPTKPSAAHPVWRQLPPFLTTLAVALALVLAAVIGDVLTTTNHSRDALTTTNHPPFPRSDYVGLPGPKPGSILVGSNYSHYRFAGCSWNDTDILTSYALDHVWEIVHHQLLSMRRNGVQTLRTIVWYMSDPGPNRWGPVASAGGKLDAPERANFIAYLSEVRRFHFRRLTITFAPMWTNDPIDGPYDPAKFTEDWHFIQYIRTLLKRYGPRDTRIDLLNEGAPSDYLPAWQFRQMATYDRRMYALYVHHYGHRDVTISVIAPESPADAGDRLQNLIDIIRSAGLPEPTWFDIHAMLSYRDMRYALQNTQAVLVRNRLSQPIVIGEAPYDDPDAARAIRQFARATGRVDEVLEWYHRPGQICNASPPYSVSAYGGIPHQTGATRSTR